MKIIYKSYQWMDNQAKTLETKTLNRAGKSLSWIGISDLLLYGIGESKGGIRHRGKNHACIEVQTDTKTFVLDDDIYKQNKQATINYLQTNYPNREVLNEKHI